MPSTLPSHAHPSRKVRAFMRWMGEQGIVMLPSVGLRVGKESVADIGVFALADLKAGDSVVTIPKNSCITVRTTGAAKLLEEAELQGGLAVVVALMYERSKGERSPWFGYLQMLPDKQDLPFLWSAKEVDSFLGGTELHQEIKRDQHLVRAGWLENIVGLSELDANEFPREWFTLEHYSAARALYASRSFEIDYYHGYGMVPVADLFNHKTAGNDIQLALVDDSEDEESEEEIKASVEVGHQHETRNKKFKHATDPRVEARIDESNLDTEVVATGRNGQSDVLEMHLVKDVAKNSEVFNTYGTLSNAALLSRYGFTEPNNPYDIVNVDIALVTEACEKAFSNRHVRRRMSLWRKTGHTASGELGVEYFEICFDGKPERELLLLLFIMHLPEDECEQLSLSLDAKGGVEEAAHKLGWVRKAEEEDTGQQTKASRKNRRRQKRRKITTSVKAGAGLDASTGDGLASERNGMDSWVMTRPVGQAVLELVQARDGLYPSPSLEEDLKALSSASIVEQPRLYHGLSIRIAERTILRKCRAYIAGWLSNRR